MTSCPRPRYRNRRRSAPRCRVCDRARVAQMRAVLLAARLAFACKIDLDHQTGDDGGTGRACKTTTAAVCMTATTHSDFAWIETNIFLTNCFGSSCHTGTTASGKLDLSMGKS